CDRIALMQTGRLLSIDKPSEIIARYPEKLYAIKSASMYKLLQALRNNPNILSAYAFGEYLHISFKTDDPRNQEELWNDLQKKNHEGLDMKPVTPGIEDCFIRLLK